MSQLYDRNLIQAYLIQQSLQGNSFDDGTVRVMNFNDLKKKKKQTTKKAIAFALQLERKRKREK